MKRIVKNLLVGVVALCSLASVSQAAQLTFAPTVAGVYLISTNRASVYNIELTGANPVLVEFFDQDATNAPYNGTNYVAASYYTRIQYATNLVTSYVGSNGFTNWYTNQGIWTANITNAQTTNALSPMGSFVVAGGTYAIYNVDMLFSRGISVRTSTNVTGVINYRSGQ